MSPAERVDGRRASRRRGRRRSVVPTWRRARPVARPAAQEFAAHLRQAGRHGPTRAPTACATAPGRSEPRRRTAARTTGTDRAVQGRRERGVRRRTPPARRPAATRRDRRRRRPPRLRLLAAGPAGPRPPPARGAQALAAGARPPPPRQRPRQPLPRHARVSAARQRGDRSRRTGRCRRHDGHRDDRRPAAPRQRARPPSARDGQRAPADEPPRLMAADGAGGPDRTGERRVRCRNRAGPAGRLRLRHSRRRPARRRTCDHRRRCQRGRHRRSPASAVTAVGHVGRDRAAPTPTPAPQTSVAGQLAASLRTLQGREDGVHVMTVRLHPDELGPVRIVARLTGNDVHLRVTTSTVAAAAAVSEAGPRLHDALAGSGLTATGVSVDHDAEPGRPASARAGAIGPTGAGTARRRQPPACARTDARGDRHPRGRPRSTPARRRRDPTSRRPGPSTCTSDRPHCTSPTRPHDRSTRRDT